MFVKRGGETLPLNAALFLFIKRVFNNLKLLMFLIVEFLFAGKMLVSNFLLFKPFIFVWFLRIISGRHE